MSLTLVFERPGAAAPVEWAGHNAVDAELKLKARRLRWLVHQQCPELHDGAHAFVADEGRVRCLYCAKEV
jgi:hypothetical protein